MLFTQIEFYLFFVAVLVASVLITANRWRKLLLLGASYYFYAYWDWRFAGLLLGCTAINYLLAARMESSSPAGRRWLVRVSVVVSLGILVFFKYFGFFTESFRAALGLQGEGLDHWNIILPVGISFYTFQTLSYTIDVYRGHLRPCARFSDFALYVAFFPQLVAGPIVRASEFLPQLERPVPLTFARAFSGFQQFVFGLFKKVFIADRLALFVDPAFENWEALGGVTLWLVIFAYALQIYCDFSGYSDMAIGAARILGYDFSKNFDHPYLATSIQDFWRRWHISLSSWLRDYLYIPLGGNRRGKARTYVNLMATMLLGGLWHGANWTFVVWGAIHGAALCLDRAITGRREGGTQGNSGAGKMLGWATTLLIVMIAWVFFRSPDFDSAGGILTRMFTLTDGVAWYHPFALGALAGMGAYHGLLALGWENRLRLEPDSIVAPAVLFTMIWLVIAYYPSGFQPFIYFQF